MSETQGFYDARKKFRDEDPLPWTMTPVIVRGFREFGETFTYGASIRTWETRCRASLRASRARRVKANIRRDRIIASVVSVVIIVVLFGGEILTRP